MCVRQFCTTVIWTSKKKVDSIEKFSLNNTFSCIILSKAWGLYALCQNYWSFEPSFSERLNRYLQLMLKLSLFISLQFCCCFCVTEMLRPKKKSFHPNFEDSSTFCCRLTWSWLHILVYTYISFSLSLSLLSLDCEHVEHFWHWVSARCAN
jgi:hypothetical protein